MKLVARKSFANVPELGLKIDPKSPNFLHPGHVQKGLRFNIGTTEVYNDLKAVEKEQVGRLIAYQVAVLDSKENEPIIAKIDAEVTAEVALAKIVPGTPAPKTS